MRNLTHQEGLQTPSTSRESLQLNQCSPSLTFAAAIDRNSIRRQTQAGLLSVCDNIDSPRPVMRVVPVAAGKSGSPCREQVEDSLFAAKPLPFDYTVDVMARRTRAYQLCALDIFSLPGSGHTSRLSTVSKAAFHTAAGLPLWMVA